MYILESSCALRAHLILWSADRFSLFGSCHSRNAVEVAAPCYVFKQEYVFARLSQPQLSEQSYHQTTEYAEAKCRNNPTEAS